MFQNYSSKIEFDPVRLEDIRDRLGHFSSLKKKYGGSIKEVLNYKTSISEELNNIHNFNSEIDTLQNEINDLRRSFSRLCVELSEKRSDITGKLEKAVIHSLADLGILNGKFKVDIRQYEKDDGMVEVNGTKFDAYQLGIDFVEFYISTNIGEKVKPLVKVVSGGEISRIMLALKTILANADKIPTLVFDEIDIGISGRIARSVGQNLYKLSSYHQLICITHLPQIASLGDVHYCVVKVVKNGRTVSQLNRLTEKERMLEIAKLLGTDGVSDTSMKGAVEMLKETRY